MRYGVHHIGINCPKKLQAEELRFWEVIGFAETGPARRGKRRNIRWLVGPGCAVLIRLGGEAPAETTDYISIYCKDIDRTARKLRETGSEPEWAQTYFGWRRLHVQSPSGRWVELIEGSPGLKAYAPLEEGEVD